MGEPDRGVVTAPRGSDLAPNPAPGGDGPDAPDDGRAARPRLGRRSTPAGQTTERTLTYNPALDGLRGLAVAAVVLFHNGFAWARGGYLGVSTFFTLSGFLITSLLLTERRATGRISLRGFWAKRMRRLLPAALVTLAGVTLVAATIDAAWERSLRGDELAAVFQVANWRFLFADRSYAELFSSPSPVLHFWSLAIEEQFYWLFPPITLVLLAVGRGSLRVYGAGLALLLGASVAGTLALGPDHSSAVYYGTGTRMAEILVGAMLAVVVAAGWRARGRWAAAVGVAGVAGLGLSVWAWATVDQASPGLYRGGLVVYAVATAAVVAAAQLRRGPVARALAVEPLRRLGLVSYGLYLFHWPVFVVLDAKRTGLAAGSWALLGVRLAVALTLAVASYIVIERPIRTGRWPVRLPAPALAASGVAVVAAVAVAVPAVWPAPPDQFADRLAAAQAESARRAAEVPPDRPRVLFFGDSTALMVAAGVGAWGLDTKGLVWVGGVTELGCGLMRDGEIRHTGAVGKIPARCADWPDTWAAAVDKQAEARIAVVMSGPWDAADHRLPGDDRWRSPTDPVLGRVLYDDIAAATDLLRSKGLVVVWLTSPRFDYSRVTSPPPPGAKTESDPARIGAINSLVRRVAAERRGVAVVDLAGYMANLPPGEDERLRPDGIHLTLETSGAVARWLAPRILSAAASVSRPASG